MVLKKALIPTQVGLILLGISCAGNSKKVQKLDTVIEDKGQVGEKKLGIDKDGVAVLQSEKMADDELRELQWANNRLMEKVETEHTELDSCRVQISDRRVGGSGRKIEIPEVDDMKPIDEIKQSFGFDDEGRLKVVNRQDFADTLNNETRFNATLKKTLATLQKHNRECHQTLARMRTKKGLAPKQNKAEGYFDADGNWNETKGRETDVGQELGPEDESL